LRNLSNESHLSLTQGIYKEMQKVGGDNSPDELLHVDSGVVMTYRVIIGAGSKEHLKTHEELDALRYKSILEARIN
jgi:hypothetical protein